MRGKEDGFILKNFKHFPTTTTKKVIYLNDNNLQRFSKSNDCKIFDVVLNIYEYLLRRHQLWRLDEAQEPLRPLSCCH